MLCIKNRTIIAAQAHKERHTSFGKNLGKFSFSKLCVLGAVLLAAGTWEASAQSRNLLSETFPANEIQTQGLPPTAKWLNSTGIPGFTYGKGALTMHTATDSRALRQTLALFTDDGTVDLEVGGSLSVDFAFSITRKAASQNSSTFRVGLFNSGGNRPAESATGIGVTDPSFNDYTGYAAMMRTNTAAADPIELQKREITNTSLLSSSDGYSSLGTGGSLASAWTNTNYTGKLVVTRTAPSSLTVSIKIDGGDLAGYSYSAVDSSSPFSSFDTIAFYGADSAFDTLTLRSVNVMVDPAP